jgi:transposase
MHACTAGQRVDFRKGHDGLASIAQAELGFAPKTGVMVVFRSKRGDPLPGNTCLHV